MTYSGTKFEVARSRCIYKKIHYLTFDLDLLDLDLPVKVTQNVAQYPLHHVTYSGTKFEVATSNSLGGDAFTRKYFICPLTLRSRSQKYVAQYALLHWTYSGTIFGVAMTNGLGRVCIYKKIHYFTFDPDLGVMFT